MLSLPRLAGATYITVVAVAFLAIAVLAGCGSSSGGGSKPPPAQVIVLPEGAKIVCKDGSEPPCK